MHFVVRKFRYIASTTKVQNCDVKTVLISSDAILKKKCKSKSLNESNEMSRFQKKSAVFQDMDNAAARSSNANPVTWIHSASGDKFPFQMDLTHPLWQTFLESGSLSPTQFFRMFFSPPTYFHNPTPWRSRRNSSAR